MRRVRRLVILGVLVAASTLPSPPASAFKVSIHESLTAEALPFLSPAILSDINNEHLYQDTEGALSSERHADNCMLREATDYMNQQYTRSNGSLGEGGVLAELEPGAPQPFDATDEFGQMLHTAEDFYAHSNWVELGRTDLIDSGLGPRAPLVPWALVRDDIVVAEGESLPAGWSASAQPAPKTPQLTTGAGQRYRALISGTFGPSDNCYDPIALPHEGDSGLHKDDPTRPGHSAARALAVRQVAHEWCRLLHLLNGQYGYAGASVPLGLWVAAQGDPHPQGTPCAHRPRAGEQDVTVTVRRVRVRDDNDPFGSGEINLALVLYTGDFRDSRRRAAGPVSVSSGQDISSAALSGMSLRLSCLAGADTAVATLQAWDDDAGTNALYDDQTGDPDDVLAGVTTSTGAGANGVRQVVLSSSDLEVTLDIATAPSPDTDGDGVSDCREP